MADISKLIIKLDNPYWNKRYDACEELRVAEKLPEEALIALQKVTNDPVPLVAKAAQRALLAHTDTTQDSAEIQSEPSIQEQNYQKIGGWLILVAIGVVVTPFIYLYILYTNFLPIFTDNNTWAVLTTPGTQAYHPMWAPLIIFEILGNVGLFVFSIAVAIAFFQKRRFLPKLYITLLLSVLAFLIIDHLLSQSIPYIASMDNTDSIRGIIRGAATSAVWIAYFLKSERVKGTFVN